MAISPQTTRIRELTQQLKDFFATINTNTPAAIESISKLNKILDKMGESKFISARDINTSLGEMAKSAGLSTNQINTLNRSLTNLVATYSKIPGRGAFSPLTPQQISGGTAGSIRSLEDAGGRLTPAIKDNLLAGQPIGAESFRQEMGKIIASADVSKLKEISIALEQLQKSYRGLIRTTAEGGYKPLASDKQLEQLNELQRGMVNYRQGPQEAVQPLSKMLNVDKTSFGDMEEFFQNTLPGGERSVKALTTRMEQYGFAMKDVQRISRNEAGLMKIDLAKTSTIGDGNQMKTFTENMTVYTDKLGNILTDTQKRFRSFGSSIVRDMGEVLKWTIAIAAIYTPIQKVGEAIEEMTQSQEQLADIQIITKQSTKEVFETYKDVADVAALVSESIDGAIETYRLAYIAAGNLTNEYERSATATYLLSDSMVLAKLSGLDQAQALDILSASLKQLGMDMSEGVSLLNSWVAVSKVANVDIETLAQSFSIVGSAAENVGVDIHELNGIIAAAAEVSNKSATETGNMIRAFISGIQADTAERELARYGIAVRSASGEIRDFMDILRQIRALMDAGMITESQFGKIAETIGGGARRGAQLSAFLQNLNRIEDVAVASEMGASAYDALEVKTATLASANTRLNNSFQLLAQTLGQEGGMLSTATLLADALNLITKAVGGLVASLGSGTSLLTLGGLTAAYLAAKPATMNKFAVGTGNIAKWGGYQAGRVFGSEASRAPLATSATTYVKGSEAAGRRMGQSFMGRVASNPGWTIAGGILISSTIAQMASGEWEQVGGSIGGAAVGALLTAGSPIGAVVGSAIGQAFMGFVTEERNISQIRALAEMEPRDLKEDSAESVLEAARKDLEDAEKALVSDLKGFRSKAAANIFAGIFGDFAETLGFTKNAPIKESEDLGDVFYSAVLMAMNKIQGRGDLIENYDEMYKRYMELSEPTKGGAIETPFVTSAKEKYTQFDTFSEGYIKQQRDDLFRKLAYGEINASAFRELSTNLGSFDTNMAQMWAAIGEEFMAASANAGTFEDAYKEIADTILSLTPAESQEIINLAGDIETLSAAGKDISVVTDELVKLLLATSEYRRISEFQMPSMAGGEMVYTEPVANQIAREAVNVRDLRLDSLAPDDATREHLINEMGDLGVRIGPVMGENAKTGFFKEFEKITSSDWDEAFRNLKASGAIKIPAELQVSAMTDITKEQLHSQIMPLAREIEAIMQDADFQTNEFGSIEQSELGLILKNNVTDRIVVNQLAFSIAQQRTNELLEKQLEGIYNLPTDGTFFVPWQAVGGGSTGGEGLESTEFGGAVDKFGTFVDKLLSDVMMTDESGESRTVRDLRSMEDFMYGPAKDITLQTSETGKARIIPGYKDVSRFLQEMIAGPSVSSRLGGIGNYFGGKSSEKEPLLTSYDMMRRNSATSTREILDLLANVYAGQGHMGGGGGGNDYLSRQDNLSVSQPIASANLNLDVSTSIQVLLDGKMVARALKQYMYKDLIKVGANNPIVKRSIFI